MWTLGLGRNSAKSRPVAAVTIPAGPGSGCETETIATSQLGSSVVLKGQLAASEDLTIEGHFEGTIEVKKHTVTIGRHAEINGPILARVAVIHGTVRGRVTATDSVKIGPAGQLHGDIVAPRIAIADGAWVCGMIDTKVPHATSSRPAPMVMHGQFGARKNSAA